MRRPLLRVGSAFPDPPFDDSREPPSRLDVDGTLAALGQRWSADSDPGATKMIV